MPMLMLMLMLMMMLVMLVLQWIFVNSFQTLSSALDLEKRHGKFMKDTLVYAKYNVTNKCVDICACVCVPYVNGKQH